MIVVLLTTISSFLTTVSCEKHLTLRRPAQQDDERHEYQRTAARLSAWYFRGSHKVAAVPLGPRSGDVVEKVLADVGRRAAIPFVVSSSVSNEHIVGDDVLLVVTADVNERNISSELSALQPNNKCLIVSAVATDNGDASANTTLQVLEQVLFRRGVVQMVVYAPGLLPRGRDLVWLQPTASGAALAVLESSSRVLESSPPPPLLLGLHSLHGAPATVSLFENPPDLYREVGRLAGVDAEVLWTLSRHAHFRPVVSAPGDGQGFGHRLPSGRFTGALAALLEGGALLAANARFLKEYAAPQLEFVVPAAYADQLCVVVPRATPTSSLRLFLAAFPRPVLVNMALMPVLTAIVSHAVNCAVYKYAPSPDGPPCLWCSAATAVCLLATAPVPGLRRARRSPQRALAAASLLCGLVLMVAVQGVLVAVLSLGATHDDIDSLQQLDQSGLRVWTNFPDLDDSFSGVDDPVMASLHKKLEVVELRRDEMVRRVRGRRDASFLERRSVSRALGALRDPLVHVSAQCPRHYLLGYAVRRGCPYARRLSQVLGRALQAGLVAHWRQRTFQRLATAAGAADASAPGGGCARDRPLTLRELHAAFFLLLAGLALAAGALAAEICLHRRRRLAARLGALSNTVIQKQKRTSHKQQETHA